MLINRAIANLFQGISQQPSSIRLPTQAEEQINGYSSIVEGLKKRPPTNHVAKLRNTTATDAYIHTINRDATEQYVAVILNGDLEVYDINGTQMTVNFPNGKAYLAATTPRESFACITIADYTFVCNKSITVAMDAATVAGTLTGTVQTFAKLPASPSSGNIYKIEGDNTEGFDNYYVKYNGTVWQECANPGEQYKFNYQTLPWRLTRTGVNTFTFDYVTWGDRKSGDLVTNPKPTFVTRKINDIFFYRNRLGFATDENIVLSRSGEFFEFWQESMTALLDTDAIDVSVASTNVAIVKHAVPFNTTLLLFSDEAQFQVTTPTNTGLTPKSIQINQTTKYSCNTNAKPVPVGQDVYFSVTRGGYTGLMEYFVQPQTFSNEAADITAHVPSYIPTGVFKLIGSSIYDCVFALNTQQRNKIHMYKFYWGEDDKKAQSSWSHWELDSSDVILGGEMLASRLYLAVQRSDGIYLEYIDLQAKATDTGMGVLVHLDRKKALTGAYSSGTGLTTWTLPYDRSGTVQVVLGSGFGSKKGTQLTVSRPSSTTVTAVGDYSASTAYVGVPYTLTYTLSEIFFKDEKNSSVYQYQLKLKHIDFSYTDSGYFKVEVTPNQRGTYTYTLTGQGLGTSAILGQVSVSSGSLRVPLMAGSENLQIKVMNDSWLPCYLQAAEWNAKASFSFRRM